MKMKKHLRLNQREAFLYTLQVKHPALFMEMRLGKTLVTIRRIKMYKTCPMKIVFCPYEAMMSWEEELQNEGQQYELIIGSKKQRQQIIKHIHYNENKWYVTNHQAHLSIGNELSSIPWNVVILDESSCIRHPQSGLPAPESDIDYYCQLRFLDENIFDEANYYEFENNNFGRIGYEQLVSPEGSKYIAKRLAKNCLFQSRDDYNLGGIIVNERRYVTLPRKVMREYDRVEKELILRHGDCEEQTVYQTTKRIWLRRLCGGFAGTDLLSSAKAKELKYLVNTELKKEQIVVCAFFTKEIEFLYNYFRHTIPSDKLHGKISQKKRRESLKRFKRGETRVLFVQPGCLRYGANLSFCDTIIMYSLPDKYETYQQVIARLIDVDSEKISLVLHLISNNTLEESMIESLIRKEGRSLRMKREVQRLAKKYKKVA
jgi:SNF2 family DNA or RNA helicase